MKTVCINLLFVNIIYYSTYIPYYQTVPKHFTAGVLTFQNIGSEDCGHVEH